MTIFDSAEVSNRVRLRSIFVAALIYLIVIVATTGLALIVIVPVWIIAYILSQKEISAIAEDAFRFKKSYPFRYFGASYGEFGHVFCHPDSIEDHILGAIDAVVQRQVPASALRSVTITDIDKDLRGHDARSFKISTAGMTSRGTTVTLLLRYAHFGKLQSIQWWVLAGGYIDKDKRFNFIAYAPLLIWLWIIPYLKHDYDIVPKMRSIYSSTYNYFDVETQVKGFHEVVFNALIAELERNGIDTSELKVQRMQVMNISISGGRVQMGNVVQGAMNKVVGSVGSGQMSNGIGITISGGTGSFGNVVQGDRAVVTSGDQSIVTQRNAALADVYQALERDKAAGAGLSDEELARLKADLAELKSAIEKGTSGRWASFGDAAKTIYEKYGWAAVPLKKLFSILLPGWIPG